MTEPRDIAGQDMGVAFGPGYQPSERWGIPNAARCDVCRRERDTMVAGSGLGPLSLAYCAECGGQYAEPEWLLRLTHEEVGCDVAEWVRDHVLTYREGRYLTWNEWLVASGIVAATAGETRQGLDERSEQSPTGEAETPNPQSPLTGAPT